MGRSEQVAPERMTALRERIVRMFNLEELRTLCSDLGVDYDSLGGEGKEAKARELVEYYKRHRTIAELETRLDAIEQGRRAATSAAQPPPPRYSSECPFLAGPMIRDARFFVGRTDELHAITARMSGAQPISINIVGERRIGKSSLLYHLFQTAGQRLPDPHRYVVIYLSLQDSHCQTETGFYQQVARELLKRPAVGNNPTLARPLQAQLDRQSFTEAMRRWQEHGALAVLCLDEFEALLKYPREFTDGFFDGLRALMDSSALAQVVASYRPLADYGAEHRLTSRYFNVGQTIRLGELTEAEAADLARLPASTVPGAPAALSLQEQHLVRQWGGRHPYLLQLAGTWLWEARQQGHDVTWARARFEQEANRPTRAAPQIKTLGRLLRWIVWDLPVKLGRVAKIIGGAVDEVTNWVIGMIILLVIILGAIGVLAWPQVVELLQKVF